MIIAIDFDDTIVRSEFPKIIGLMPDAKEYIIKLKNDGHYLIINTCRCGNEAIEAVNFLLNEKIPFDRINENEPQNIAKYSSNSRKIYSHVTIDDKQVGGLPPWSEIYKYITEIENKYKSKAF